MFSFLKKKIKNFVEKVKKKVRKESEEEKEVKKIKKKEKKEVKEKVEEKKKIKEVKEKEKKEEKPKKEKKPLFGKTISKELFNKEFEDFEISLLESNVALEVIEKIKEKLENELVDKKVKNIEKEILNCLRNLFNEIVKEEDFDKTIKEIKDSGKKPIVIMLIGINGSGKTTTAGKLAKYLINKGYTVTFSASDTFRAASIEQLEKIGKMLGVKVIKHNYGSDPAAVAFDAINYAKSKGIDFVIIDTAGRLHTNANLIEELRKVKRVAKPDITIFVGDSLTGNDVVEQGRIFNEEIGFDYIILSKADVDKKGGAILSISYVTGKPIIFLGTGQSFDDLKKFNKKEAIENLFSL